MPNIGSMLKEEISRISRKQARALVEPMKKQVASQRSELVALKRQCAELKRELAAVHRGRGRTAAAESNGAAEAAESGRRSRFSAAGVKSLRQRLGLSAESLGKLLDVSGQSIYNWENGKVRPRPAQVERLAELRGTGKRKIKAMLEEGDAPSVS